jgi:ABC-type transport system involved in cytochrome c biogenesis permease subunit
MFLIRGKMSDSRFWQEHIPEEKRLDLISYRAVSLGFLFLTFVIISGAIWAEHAWGSYWSWDPKETWALVTWSVYLLYIHIRLYRKGSTGLWSFLLIFAFACLQMCWWGINFLPSAQGSIHVY